MQNRMRGVIVYLKLSMLIVVIGLLVMPLDIARSERITEKNISILGIIKSSSIEKGPTSCNRALISGRYGFNARGFVATDSDPSMIVEGQRQAGSGIAEFPT